ncbi:hypothetical protein CL176_00850 [Suicoccus acidiformans]|uniref:hydroxyethylthiazole kinase n=1 Tax=Suicoccus acidiformans TaxID=2036206 RepID=A0A347WHY3_9LACT|nr:hydroxyethylthiazole kinase [Suicoccus acidiformans]AXY24690.1 hypothetical protein CL176_00850 [Suicoccus acidiformans]
MVQKRYEQIRQQSPLIHVVTNPVTIEKVANTILAAGGSPIMTDRAPDIADVCQVA